MTGSTGHRIVAWIDERGEGLRVGILPAATAAAAMPLDPGPTEVAVLTRVASLALVELDARGMGR